MKRRIKKILIVSLAVMLSFTTYVQANFVYADTEIKQTETTAKTAENICSVNGVGYTSLKEAFEKATDGSTIVLEQDITNFKTEDIVTIPKDKKVIFNMAENSITVEANDFKGRVFKNNGDFTITGNGVIDTTAARENGWGPVENYGTLTIENGTYRAVKETNAVGIWNRKGGTAYFKGGTYEGFPTIIRTAYGSTTTISGGIYTNDCYPAIENDGDMKITGGAFENTSCSKCSDKWGYTVRNGVDGKKSHLVIEEAKEGAVSITGVQGALANSCGLLEVKSGSFETVACNKHGKDPAHYALYVAGERGDSKAVVTGGTFKSVSKTTVLIGNDNNNGDGGINANATTEIKGGTFIAPEGQKAVTGAPITGNPYITGGIFKSADKASDMSEYMPSGMTQDESGKVIVKEDAVAEVDGAAYATLKEAIDEAQIDSKINLLSDVTEDIILNKDITIDGGGNFEIKGFSTIKTGTLQNLTLTPNESKADGSFLVLGNSVETKINLKNVTLKYSVTKRSTDSAVTVINNQADITINNCLFTNEANNNGITEDAKEWSYGLYINKQDDKGKIKFTNNEFNGAFRTMLPNISGNMLIEDNKFINSVYSVTNGPTGGAGSEATSITTSEDNNNKLVVINNVFDNAGAMYFQTQIELKHNKIAFDKFEHYIQAAGRIGEEVDISNNSFKMGDNDLVIIDVANTPLKLPVGQVAVNYWVWADTPENIRPVDYSDYKYM